MLINSYGFCGGRSTAAPNSCNPSAPDLSKGPGATKAGAGRVPRVLSESIIALAQTQAPLVRALPSFSPDLKTLGGK
jgi:hypothetical protein